MAAVRCRVRSARSFAAHLGLLAETAAVRFSVRVGVIEIWRATGCSLKLRGCCGVKLGSV